MTTIALPIHGEDVAPILDFSPRMLLLHLGDGGKSRSTELYLYRIPEAERPGALCKAGVSTVICGCISNSLHRELQRSGIRVIWGVAGPVRDVVAAFISDRLDDSPFQVLGRRMDDFSGPHMPLWPVEETEAAGP